MLPAIAAAMVASSLASAYLQWKGSEEARQATEEERQKMEEMFSKVRQPDFDPSQLTPEDYQVVGKYAPQVAPLVEEVAPQVIKGQSADALKGRDVEKEMLEELLQRARGGEDPLANIERNKAARQASQNAQSQRATLEAQMARRGIAPGSLAQYAASMGANQDAALREAMAGEAAAENALKRRDAAIGQSANLAGDIRNSDLDIERRNADIINAFNQRVANTKNDYNRYAYGTLNDASKYNLGVSQDLSNRGVDTRNRAKEFTMNRGDKNAQQNFQNTMAILNGKLGLGQQNIQGIQQAAQDRNAAIGGVSSGLNAGLGWYGGEAAADERAAKYGAKPAAALEGQQASNVPAKAYEPIEAPAVDMNPYKYKPKPKYTLGG